ncbi:DEAD/DEAH box helicase [Xenorhabdus koppenhoeferi]|uniref:Superfamily II DNA or RNA helicase n=1 Tax=Xenorhabdus koppenhoeferi TaxID=351659 RepID=A0A1I7K2S2_9GAMM|nr:DEAD/DEAH box helicase family protein [Xenorhabdus koppenhoeferi]SFU91753.1 Superfamily II DNA or RNA helicase [Xenorhabdus koppenhoeferi]
MAQGNPFQQSEPSISGNPLLRTPQREAYSALVEFNALPQKEEREVGIILPVGCGKSGCITLSPFAFKATRTLVVAPGLNIASQLHDDFDPARPDMFYQKCKVLSGAPYPEPAEIRGRTTNRADLEEADVVLTNIQQLQGGDNRWLQGLPDDFFDLIVFDEGHHSVAASWTTLKDKFPTARIVNFSATPLRADGQIMAGRVLYTFPVFRAIREGYVKQLKAIVLNPRTLRYVRREDGKEIEVGLEEVRRLGETDADFRRSIVTSSESLNTIVDASIRELQKRRNETGNDRLKIIASALNYEHCRQIVEAYRARGQNADYVHSREDSAANQLVLQRLEAHELDVIVQVRKLGEGFDHPFLSVAAVFSVFSNLSPFVQFVGRIMRVIEQNSPGHPLNHGTVIFHAGANVASRWEDFQQYSEADKAFFDQLLPVESLDFTSGNELEVELQPREFDRVGGFNVEGQTDVELQEIHLIQDNPEALAALKLLRDAGYSSDQVKQEFERLEPVPITKVRQRQAMRASLDQRVRTEVGRILGERGISHEGHNLDRKHLGRTNFVILKSAIDKQINDTIGRTGRSRDEFTQADLDQIEADFNNIILLAIGEVFGG